MHCRYVDTSGMTKDVACTECECFDKDGIRATGGCNAKAWLICFAISGAIWGLLAWLIF